jgi:predicted RNase H-like HicB family nuclease
MIKTYTAKYTKIPSGYMGQLVEWPEVITEGKNLEDCRALLQDALQEMIAAYRQQEKEIPFPHGPGVDMEPWTLEEMNLLADEAEEMISRRESHEQ